MPTLRCKAARCRPVLRFRKLGHLLIGLMTVLVAGAARAQEVVKEHTIEERLEARLGVIDLGAAVVPFDGSLVPGFVFLPRGTLVTSEMPGARFEFLRFGFGVSAQKPRLTFSLGRIDEIAIGSNGAGKPCFPQVFRGAPARDCDPSSGLFGFGASFLEMDSLARRSDLVGESVAIRVAEGTARLLLPGGALGTSYQRFRLPIFVGTALDWLQLGEDEDGVTQDRVVPRLTTGAEVAGRSEDGHFEAKASFTARPSMVDWGEDVLIESAARVTARFVGPWQTVAAMQSISLEAGYGYASRPEGVVGEHLSKVEQDSAWMMFRYEVTLLSFFPD